MILDHRAKTGLEAGMVEAVNHSLEMSWRKNKAIGLLLCCCLFRIAKYVLYGARALRQI